MERVEKAGAIGAQEAEGRKADEGSAVTREAMQKKLWKRWILSIDKLKRSRHGSSNLRWKLPRNQTGNFIGCRRRLRRWNC